MMDVQMTLNLPQCRYPRPLDVCEVSIRQCADLWDGTRDDSPDHYVLGTCIICDNAQ